ncbi:hypothetical protein BDQ12DRAFT_648909 [Crucibulum laeve]|uniref:Gamma-glutamylcyclotransferase AIG2-like domain-containing protein n=1 Tax=Crucibulum laeve TaxID=68775 RepID=A0A5C3M4R7_9AGAR|nr:hypothetical protein BDQ12DRAFT_648909 [Crucibulum laeve]
MSSSIPERRAFFYGTLMHPKILTRVIDNDGAHLQFCSALLLDYTRHEVMVHPSPLSLNPIANQDG